MELREQILQTATALFREKGLKFTMQDVSSEMHVAKKTIYKLYPSKEELLLDLVKNGFAKIQEAKQKVLDSDLPMKDKVARVLIELPEEFKTIDFRNLNGIAEKYPLVWKEITKNLGSEWEPIFQLLEDGKKQGVIHDISLPVLKQVVTASIDSFLYSNDLKTAGITYHEALQHMSELLMKGVWNDKTE